MSTVQPNVATMSTVQPSGGSLLARLTRLAKTPIPEPTTACDSGKGVQVDCCVVPSRSVEFASLPVHAKQVDKQVDRGRHTTFLRQYLMKNGYLFFKEKAKKRKSPESPAPVHPRRLTFFNGGSAHFPYSAWPGVQFARCQDILDENGLFDNDIALSDEGVKLFFDLDYVTKVPLDDLAIREHVLELQNVVRSYFGTDVDASVWVVSRPAREKAVKNEFWLGQGYHFIFRNIVVTCDQGTQISHTARSRFNGRFQLPDTVDADCYKSVNQTANLRPIYSHKMDKCPACKDHPEQRLTCGACRHYGKVEVKGVYTCAQLLDSKGRDLFPDPDDFAAHVHDNLLAVVRETSIVASVAGAFTPQYVVPAREPNYLVVTKGRRRNVRPRGVVQNESELVRATLKGLIRAFHPLFDYDDLALGISRTAATIFISLDGIGMNTCFIADASGSEHRSNRIYFEVNLRSRAIRQLCYDSDCKQTLAEWQRTSAPQLARLSRPITSSNLSVLFARSAAAPSSGTTDFVRLFLERQVDVGTRPLSK